MFPSSAGKEQTEPENRASGMSRIDAIAKGCVLCTGLLKLSYAIGILNSVECLATASFSHDIWFGYTSFTLVYMLVVAIAVMLKNEKAWLLVTGLAITGIIVSLMGFTVFGSISLAFIVLDSVAALLSLHIAVETAAVQVAAARLSLECYPTKSWKEATRTPMAEYRAGLFQTNRLTST